MKIFSLDPRFRGDDIEDFLKIVRYYRPIHGIQLKILKLLVFFIVFMDLVRLLTR
ncbi:MAG TPA: hypothetical protein LFV92_06960 [Rickettsia endosymbiont of Ceroptres masudai]|nr:hypothetical protein [Rickettsia endosymbiont of Ceroptres masudai]